MLFQFEHMDLDRDPDGLGQMAAQALDLADLKRVMTRWQKDLDGKGWNSLYLAITTSRAPSPALATTAATASSRPSCWPPSCTCCTARPTSTRAKRSG